jgi:hypothetical protein
MLEDSHKDKNMEWQELPEADKIIFPGDDAFFEEAWGGIQEQLPQPSRAIGLGWLALGILLLLSPFTYNDAERAENQMLAKESPVETEAGEVVDTEVRPPKEAVSKLENDELSNSSSTESDNEEKRKIAANLGQQNVRASKKTSIASAASNVVEEPIGKSEMVPNINYAVFSAKADNSEDLLTSRLPLVWTDLVLEAERFDVPGPAELVLSKNKKVSRLWLGAYMEYGQNQWLGQSKRGNYHSVDYELTSGYWKEAGVKLALPLTARQSVELRLGYGVQRLAAHYDLSVNYGSTGEYSDGMGHLHRNYSHTLNTLVGEMDLKHVLYRKETDRLQEGERVGFTLSVEQDLDIIPIGMSYLYDLPLSGSVFLQSGLGVDASYFRNQVQGTRIALKSHHQMMHHNYTEIGAHNPHTAQPWMIAATVSLGIGYDWRAYRFIMNAQVQETLVEPELNLGAHLHPTLLTGSLSVLRAF